MKKLWQMDIFQVTSLTVENTKMQACAAPAKKKRKALGVTFAPEVEEGPALAPMAC